MERAAADAGAAPARGCAQPIAASHPQPSARGGRSRRGCGEACCAAPLRGACTIRTATCEPRCQTYKERRGSRTAGKLAGKPWRDGRCCSGAQAPSREAVYELIQKLRDQGKTSLTVLLLGAALACPRRRIGRACRVRARAVAKRSVGAHAPLCNAATDASRLAAHRHRANAGLPGHAKHIENAACVAVEPSTRSDAARRAARHAGRRARPAPDRRMRPRARAPGKGGVGKSSTVNSLLNERAANVAALQSDITRPQIFARSSDGFTVTLIDTPGLLEADAVSDTARSPASSAGESRARLSKAG